MAQLDQPRIVGRAEPLRRLGEALAASAQGRRSCVLVSGEAGMGKTSLIGTAIEAAGDGGLVVGWGTCWHGDGAPGFWPWSQALGALARLVGAEAALAAAGQDADSLGALVRELGPTPSTTDEPDRHRLLLLDAAVRWLEALAGDRPVVIVLDDLQWADASTFDLLDHAIATPVAARLLVIGSYRHDELDEAATARLAALGARSDHIHLEGLTVGDVEELVASIAEGQTDRAEAAELHRRTGGHPLFVSELARLPAGAGVLPTVVTGAVARRLETVAPESRALLDVASALGNQVLLDVLGTVTGASGAEVLRLLHPASDAGLVRTTADGEFWFAHDLFRETLYGQLGPARRSDLHGRIGDALEARSRRGGRISPGELADHFARAARTGGPAKAIHWARQAAIEERRRSAFAEAAGHLRRARTAALDAGWSIEPELLVQLLVDEADSQARSGEPDIARDLLLRAATLAPGPTQQADVALAVQRLGAKFAAPRDEVIGQLETALADVTGVDLARQAKLTAALARELQHSVAEDRLRAGPLSRTALALGRDADDDETLLACLLARHDALWAPGTGAERAEMGHEISLIGARLRDTDRRAEGLLLEANGLLESGSARFRPVLDRWFGLLEARDEPRDRYLVATRRAALALLDGDTAAASILVHEAALIGERIHEPDTGNVLMSQRVALAHARHEPDELRALAADAVRWWQGAPVLAHSVSAGAFAAVGDVAAAAREIAMVVEAGGWQSEGSYLRSVLVAHLAVAATAVGDVDLCGALFSDVELLVDSCGVNGAVVAFAGPFAHTAGILAAALGDRDTAHRMLRQSVETARRLGANVWVEQGEAALRTLDEAGASDAAAEGDRSSASLVRTGKFWTVSWHGEQGIVPHVKGIGDLVVLVTNRGVEVSALQLAGGVSTRGRGQDMVDLQALDSYRSRLEGLTAEIDEAADAADIGRVAQLEGEREELLAEIGRVTGLGGRVRTNANDPAERARKAVSARLRDAITRISTVAPQLAAHLDRSIRTGLHCSYVPPGDEPAIAWTVS